jgi:hypothetical protein
MKPQAPPEEEKEPSEFSKIMRSSAPAKPPGAAESATPKESTGSALPKINVSVPRPAVPHIPTASAGGAGVHASAGAGGLSATSALGSAHVAAPKVPGLKSPALNAPAAVPQAQNKKLIVFFVVLGVLALLLVLLMLFLMKK